MIHSLMVDLVVMVLVSHFTSVISFNSVNENVRFLQNKCIQLRNEINFSGVHGAMNRSGSRAK